MAAKPSIDGMSFEELMELKAAVDAALSEKANAKRKELMAQLQALDEAVGRAHHKQADNEPRRTRGTPAPKYRSKKNPDVTWSGRGADPNWLKAEMEESGDEKSSFLIDKQAA